MPFFDDRGFYKRAQIAANDLHLAGVVDFARHRPPDDLRRQPRPARPAPGRRAASTPTSSPQRIDAGARADRRRRVRARAARLRRARLRGARAASSASPPRAARQLALEPRPAPALQRAPRAHHAHRLLLRAMDAFEGDRRGARVPDVHRHRPRRRGAARLPGRLHHAGEHRPAALHRVPVAQEPHVPRRPRRDPRSACTPCPPTRRTWRSCSAARPATRSTSSPARLARGAARACPILDRCDELVRRPRPRARWDAGDHDAFLLEPIAGELAARRPSSRSTAPSAIDPGHDA